MTTCAGCGRDNDSVSSLVPDDPIGIARPPAGAVSICFRCGHLALYTGRGEEVREPTRAERDELIANPEVRRVLAVRSRFVAERGL